MRRAARTWQALALVATLATVLGGCALKTPGASTAQVPPSATPESQVPVPQAVPPPAPTGQGVPGNQVGTTASGGSITINPADTDSVPVVLTAADSTPSRDAVAVLESIPDPLGRRTSEAASAPATRPAPATPPVVPPSTPGAATPSGGTEAPATGDTSATPADTSGAPVPEPTRPLGDGPGSRVTMPDTISGPPPTSSTPPPPASPPPSPSASSSPDSCWRVQVAAKPERLVSERLMTAAQSQLGQTWVVERENSLYKVRTRDCLSEAGAEALRRRAVDAGFEGSFKLRKR